MYLPVPVLAVLGIALLALALLALRRRGGGRDLIAPPRPGAPMPPRAWPAGAAPIGDLPPEVEAEVRALAAAGNKIEAIKMLRAATRWSLLDAKEAVERM
jgi:hypothetical protein